MSFNGRSKKLLCSQSTIYCPSCVLLYFMQWSMHRKQVVFITMPVKVKFCRTKHSCFLLNWVQDWRGHQDVSAPALRWRVNPWSHSPQPSAHRRQRMMHFYQGGFVSWHYGRSYTALDFISSSLQGKKKLAMQTVNIAKQLKSISEKLLCWYSAKTLTFEAWAKPWDLLFS